MTPPTGLNNPMFRCFGTRPLVMRSGSRSSTATLDRFPSCDTRHRLRCFDWDNIAPTMAPSTRSDFILSDDLRGALESLASTRREQRNAVLFRRGEPAHGVYVIRRGSVVLGFNDHVHRRACTGSILGLPAVFSGQPYSLTATVAHDCELAFITREKILELVHLKPILAVQLLEILATEVEAVREMAFGNDAVR